MVIIETTRGGSSARGVLKRGREPLRRALPWPPTHRGQGLPEGRSWDGVPVPGGCVVDTASGWSLCPPLASFDQTGPWGSQIHTFLFYKTYHQNGGLFIMNNFHSLPLYFYIHAELISKSDQNTLSTRDFTWLKEITSLLFAWFLQSFVVSHPTKCICRVSQANL